MSFVASSAAHMTAQSKLNTSQVIKASIALRAKYRLDQDRATPTLVRWAPALAVPHPKNRGGDPVKSSRTVQLSGDLVKDGFDPIEADSNAVAVEQHPDAQADEGFQAAFEKKILVDPDMAAKVSKICAIGGTLSHSHLNCCLRNMAVGARGCECPPAVAGK